ncbi:hypothetical protein BKA66DRAFT_614682 [Pyrenochaeta sp. MPI-SDFR-AT-0127]|nr:hypothetical protein BKA66DRAFT_614682 [Pyrenochaeta sp. MPI-SDFR-AT-0127]
MPILFSKPTPKSPVQSHCTRTGAAQCYCQTKSSVEKSYPQASPARFREMDVEGAKGWSDWVGSNGYKAFLLGVSGSGKGDGGVEAEGGHMDVLNAGGKDFNTSLPAGVSDFTEQESAMRSETQLMHAAGVAAQKRRLANRAQHRNAGVECEDTPNRESNTNPVSNINMRMANPHLSRPGHIATERMWKGRDAPVPLIPAEDIDTETKRVESALSGTTEGSHAAGPVIHHVSWKIDDELDKEEVMESAVEKQAVQRVSVVKKARYKCKKLRTALVQSFRIKFRFGESE